MKAATLRSSLSHIFGRAGRLVVLSAVAAVAAGCATQQPIMSYDEFKRGAVEAQIDEAIKRMNEQPHWATSLDDRAAFASFATNAVSVSYQGSAADLMKAIAASRNMSFKVTGPAPHIPIFVFVEAVEQPFEDFMRDLSKQFGQRADVVWGDNVFELRYR